MKHSSKTVPTSSHEMKTILSELIRFSIPLILSGILQQLYSWADAFIVGNVEGELALGAIGGTGTVTSFLVMAMSGFTIGLSVLSGQKFGSREMAFVRKILKIFRMVLGLFFLVMAGVGILLARPFLELINTPSDTIELAKIYIQIVFVGIPFLAVYNVYSAVLRGVGDSKAPFYAILVSSLTNVALDALMVAVLRWGIAGAAVATILSQIIMTLFMVIYTVKKHPELKTKKEEEQQISSGEVVRSSIRFGLPPMIQSCISAVGNLVLQNFQNGFGTATVIAITASYRIDSLALLPVINLGSAISTLTAQSYGAKDYEKVRLIRKGGLIIMAAVSILLTSIIIPSGPHLVRIFGAGEEAVAIGASFFIYLASFYLFFGIGNALRGFLEGVGDMVFASTIGFVMLFTRIIGSYLLVGIFDNMVIAVAEGIAWVLSMVLYMIRTHLKNKKLPQ